MTAETPRILPTRHRDRFSAERSAAYAVLDATPVCHVGYVVDGRPLVLPQLQVRCGDWLYLHASSGSRAARSAVRGAIPVSVTVTVVDGIVLARSAFNHSINYRSVVVNGLADLVADPAEKSEVLAALVDGVVAGRSAGVRGPTRRELAATAVLRLALDDIALKTRSGPPVDDPEDLGLPYWAGVLPVTTVVGDPQAAPDLDPAVGLPEHVRAARS